MCKGHEIPLWPCTYVMKAFCHSQFQCYLGTQTLQDNVFFMKATTYTKIALLV